MDKERIKIGAMLTALILLGGAVGFSCGLNFNKFVDDWDYPDNENYITISHYRNQDLYRIDQRIAEGEQYDYIMVEDFIAFDDEGFWSPRTTGFLKANETTGKIEFHKWKEYTESSYSFTTVDTTEWITVGDYWLEKDWLIKHLQGREYKKQKISDVDIFVRFFFNSSNAPEWVEELEKEYYSINATTNTMEFTYGDESPVKKVNFTWQNENWESWSNIKNSYYLGGK